MGRSSTRTCQTGVRRETASRRRAPAALTRPGCGSSCGPRRRCGGGGGSTSAARGLPRRMPDRSSPPPGRSLWRLRARRRQALGVASCSRGRTTRMPPSCSAACSAPQRRSSTRRPKTAAGSAYTASAASRRGPCRGTRVRRRWWRFSLRGRPRSSLRQASGRASSTRARRSSAPRSTWRGPCGGRRRRSRAAASGHSTAATTSCSRLSRGTR
mmetsp:Transcript_80871/g.237707  ORF Transcript_80871/g.237707 Transcript_80871/m.237707 type:complete len:213 (-) Transcript_80871:487-1125(-)